MLKDLIKDNQRICFLGDSITARGTWLAEVYQYLVDYFPAKGLKLFNCGVSSEYTARGLKRLYVDCLNYSPDYVVIMYGMNDCKTGLYKDNIPSEEKTTAIINYRMNLETIVKLCKKNGAQVILCTPTVYDSYSLKEQECLPYVNDALGECSRIVKELVVKENLMLVDFFDVMKLLVEQGNYDLINEDRVHPSDRGHHLMAQVFLRDMGFTEKINLEEMPVFSEHNQKRLELERTIRSIMFVEWAVMHDETVEGKLTLEEKKYISKERYPECEWYPHEWKIFNENRDNLDLMRKHLYELTIGMYEV